MNKSRMIRRGYTLLETLISLSIVAALMVSMAAAMSTTGSAIEMNDRFFRSLQQARAAENYINTEIRRATSVTVTSSSSITLTSPDLANATISYNSSNQQITLTCASVNSGLATVLAANVSSATFAGLTGTNLTNNTVTTSVSLTMTIQINENMVTLSDSAAPRANCVALYQ